MDAAVGIILSPALQVLFDRLASPVLQGLADRLGFNYNIFQSLQHALVRAQATLADAEVQQFTNKTVRLWLSDLKNAVCDAEDLLDVFTAKQTCMIDEDFGEQTLDSYAVLTDKVRKILKKLEMIVGEGSSNTTTIYYLRDGILRDEQRFVAQRALLRRKQFSVAQSTEN
ncbi:hypothetical protein L3X38_043062 [Prunus dulcis]|uniref:Disease resistance N-terminal domain-containing protein n=1 Tax=Prunus dulcis TaxID=3755 RepID=A0AAD4UXF3_PRUDU|nr:hypothetical protein L3X38_043062 [Prunus dulcis]